MIEGKSYMRGANGFLITGKEVIWNKQKYFGVDTEPWPIDFQTCSKFDNFEKELLSNIYIQALTQEKSVFLLNKFLACKYVQECLENNKSIRILYCETNAENLMFDETLNIFTKLGRFLGFDYAYGGDDFYSCVLNDLICRPELFKENSYLNEYGLLSSEYSSQQFISERNILKKESKDPYLFENGDYIIYKIFEVCPEKLICL